MSEILDPYAAWKSRIRKFGKLDSLRVIWAYHNFNLFWTPIPEDIVPPKEFYDEWNRGLRYISTFFLVSYFRDILAFAWNRWRITLRDSNQFWALQNLCNQLTAWGIIEEENETKTLSVRLYQIAYQQFKWQIIQKDYFFYINSYASLYSDNTIDTISYEILWISSKRILEIWFLFFVGNMNNFSIRIDDSLVSKDELRNFLNIFWASMEDLSKQLRATHKNNFSFEFSWIREMLNRPIIILEENLFISPLPVLLLRWLLEWIYYKCIGIERFKKAFSEIFQDLCFKILVSWLLNKANKIGTDKELVQWFNSSKKPPNPDFYIECKDCILFLDSKYISVSQEVSDLSRYINHIKQWWSFIEAYRNNTYSQVIKNLWVKEFVIFITPFDTFFSFWVDKYTVTNSMLEKMRESGEFQDYNFMFMWINELHRFMQLGSKYWFREILDMKFSDKFRNYEMLGFMNEIAENWYNLEYSQYDFEWYDFMDEIMKKYNPSNI